MHCGVMVIVTAYEFNAYSNFNRLVSHCCHLFVYPIAFRAMFLQDISFVCPSFSHFRLLLVFSLTLSLPLSLCLSFSLSLSLSLSLLGEGSGTERALFVIAVWLFYLCFRKSSLVSVLLFLFSQLRLQLG